jgi:HlyD family secretion protein
MPDGCDRENKMNFKINKVMVLLPAFAIIILSGCRLKEKETFYTTTLSGTSIHAPSLTGGVINRMLVKEGDWVEVDDTLAVLDTRELKYQIEQIDVSLKELNIQTIIAQNSLIQSRSDVSYIQEKQQRTQRLYQAESIAKQNLDDMQNLLQKSQTLSTNANSQYELMKASQDRLLAQKKILLKKVSDAIILAPAKGKITTLYYRQGEAIPPFANLLEVIDTKTLQAKFYVSEQTLGNLKTGQTVSVITESGQSYSAVISYFSDKAEFTPKAVLTTENRAAMVYAVTVKVDNPQDMLKDGMPVEVKP